MNTPKLSKYCKTIQQEPPSERIGATDIAALLGQDSYNTPLDIYYRIKEGIHGPKTIAQELGKALEKTIIQTINDQMVTEHLKEAEQSKEKYINEKFPKIRFKPDGWCTYKENRIGLEIKYGDSNQLPFWTPIPPKYYIQCQTYLMLTGLTTWAIVGIIGNIPKYEIIEANEKIQKDIEQAYTKFIQCLEKNKPPKATAKDYDTLKDRILPGQYESHDPNLIKLIEKYDENNETAKKAKKAADEAKTQILQEIIEENNNNIIIHAPAIEKKLIVQEITQKRVDTNRLKEDNLYDNYTKETTYKKITIK